jgi:MYXO-CTERM domain-containing protein
MCKLSRSLVLLVLAWPAIAGATPNPWGFDFDSNIAEDPAYVRQRVQDLARGLPALPADGIAEVAVDQVQLYFFTELAEALVRARDAGPAPAPPISRPSQHCVLHAAFSRPTLRNGSSSGACAAAENGALAAFDDDALDTCTRAEFPETYVYDHQPLGQVDFGTVSTLESLISFAGEALTHVEDYREGLLPDDLMPTIRRVIAKLRYPTLKQQLAQRTQAYRDALVQLKNAAHCFDPAALSAFETTVNGLVGELDAVGRELDAIHNAGLAQATQDRRGVEAQGRLRVDLPHPALTDRERELLAFYIGGLYWRMRGAGLVAVPPDPGQGLLRRLLYVQYPYQLIAELTGGMVDAEGVGLSVFIQENYGYAEWFDMGNSPGRDKYADLVDMTIRGKVDIELVAPQLEGRGFDVRPLVAGGLQMGPCYYYAWERLRDFRLGAELQDPYMQFLEWPTAVGEFCTGAALGLGLARTLLWGKPGGCVANCEGRSCGEDDGCGRPCGACAGDAGPIAPGEDGGGAPAVADGGIAADGGHVSPTREGFDDRAEEGCSCEMRAAADAGHGAWLFLLGLALVLASRRRGRSGGR